LAANVLIKAPSQRGRTLPQSSTEPVIHAPQAQSREALTEAGDSLRLAAGNFYRPARLSASNRLAWARRSGMNDKAGSALDLVRWVSPRTVKETSVAAIDYRS